MAQAGGQTDCREKGWVEKDIGQAPFGVVGITASLVHICCTALRWIIKNGEREQQSK
jgi:hypothetical protein